MWIVGSPRSSQYHIQVLIPITFHAIMLQDKVQIDFKLSRKTKIEHNVVVHGEEKNPWLSETYPLY